MDLFKSNAKIHNVQEYPPIICKPNKKKRVHKETNFFFALSNLPLMWRKSMDEISDGEGN